MGVTIESRNRSIDLGYGGFRNLRMKVAELSAPDIYEHYEYLEQSVDLNSAERVKFFDAYNQKIQELDEKYDGKYTYVLDFLYASDCDASMDLEHCKSIYDIIKEYDDKVCYGYIGRPDCAMFSDFKEVIKDAIESGEGIEWF